MCYASASRNDWSEVPVFWMLILMVTPSLCFACGTVLASTRQHSRLSRFDWSALVAAILPVTLGSWMAVWAVKVLFGASIQEASIELRMFGALACLALVAISGVMIRQAGMNLLSTKQQDEKPAAC
jgi:uncharacterized membrane protein YfcA